MARGVADEQGAPLMLTPSSLPEIQAALEQAKLDGWLLYDFHGLNPVATGLLRQSGMATRRIFVFIPRLGAPVAITHAIEQGPWQEWPREWKKEIYSGWRSLETHIAGIVGGKKVAMEYSPGDAVPYLDRVPAGVIEMVRAAGAEVVTSGELVSRFYAVWNPEQRASHERASKVIAGIAQEAMRLAGSRADSGDPLTEFALQSWIKEMFAAKKLSADHGPIVAIGPNASNPHYEPTAETSAPIRRGDVLLIDLWATERDGVYADQTWMASLGKPSERDGKIFLAIRDARDAAIALIRARLSSGETLRGGEVDDAARAVIAERGYSEFFTHRTGHSIDARDLHGSGPHIDNLETREERALIPGIGFSIEPGIYLAGEVGMRTEVNGFIAEDGLLITPDDYQREILIV